jgi:hypothetical protein
MKKFMFYFLSLMLTGCGGNLLLIDKNNQQSTGSFNSMSKSLEINHKGRVYSGFYITNSGIAFGSAQAFGTKPSYGNSQTFYSGNSGRAALRSVDGDTIQCEFNFQGMQAIGTCLDNAGEVYQLITQ